MAKFKGGDTVKAGFYWNPKEWEATIVPREGGPLPGAEDIRYFRMPLPALLVMAPAMGAVFAIFLPFIGIAMLAGFLTGRLRKSGKHTPPAVDAGAHEKHAA
jgi:hypothetical protein